MKKRNRWLAGVLAAVTLLGGCGGAGQETLKQTDAEGENQATETAVEDTASATEQIAETEQTGPVTFTDDLGREVTVDHPQRVAALIGTLVFLMGIGNLAAIADKLIAAGKSGGTPAAVVRQNTDGSTQAVRGNLHNIAKKVKEAGIETPAVIVIGETAGLQLFDEQ